MLSKAYRLPSSEIRQLMHIGKRTRYGIFNIVYRTNLVQTPRCAFVVASHITKRATDRNRLKRLMREATSRLLNDLKSNVDVIVSLINQPTNATVTHFEASLRELFKHESLL